VSQLFQTPFGRHSTAAEVIEGIDLSGDPANAERLWDTARDLLPSGDPP
jgi:hypothetical protein